MKRGIKRWEEFDSSFLKLRNVLFSTANNTVGITYHVKLFKELVGAKKKKFLKKYFFLFSSWAISHAMLDTILSFTTRIFLKSKT